MFFSLLDLKIYNCDNFPAQLLQLTNFFLEVKPDFLCCNVLLRNTLVNIPILYLKIHNILPARVLYMLLYIINQPITVER